MGNIRRIFQGHIDEGISGNGRRQLERLTERFRDVPLDAIYSSPLQRAMYTAEAVDGAHGLPIVQDRRLMEIHGGVWESPENVAVALPGTKLQMGTVRLWDFHPRKGEAMREVYSRMAEALTEIAAAHPDETVAVASHGCAIRNAPVLGQGLAY